MKNKIVIDSAGDIKEFGATGFSSVPLKIIAGDKEFTDNENIDVSDMVEYLKSYKGKVSTSCPGVGEYLDAFSDAENTYVITITSGLSGSYNSACVAAQNYISQNPDHKIHVFDSLSAGPEMLLIAEKVRDLINQKFSFNEIVKKAEEYQKKTHLIFSLESLHNLANNGRIPSAVAKVVGMLGIKLIGKASDEGKLQPIGKARGEKKSIPEIIKNMLAMGYSGGKLRIAHCFNEQAAAKIKEAILNMFPAADTLIYPTAGLCSFYAEQGGLLIGFETA